VPPRRSGAPLTGAVPWQTERQPRIFGDMRVQGVLAGRHIPRAPRPGRRSRCHRLAPSEPTRLRLRRPGSGSAPAPTAAAASRPSQSSGPASRAGSAPRTWLTSLTSGRTEPTPRAPDRAQAQAPGMRRPSRSCGKPGDIRRRPAQTATRQEPAPGSPAGLSPGSEPGTTAGPRDFNHRRPALVPQRAPDLFPIQESP
jgi:hypothetical protein